MTYEEESTASGAASATVPSPAAALTVLGSTVEFTRMPNRLVGQVLAQAAEMVISTGYRSRLDAPQG